MFKKIYYKNFSPKRSAKDTNPKKYSCFIKAGGGKSGVYDISDKQTASFVRKYREFIPKNEIYKRDKRGYLVPVYKDPR
jgi:hypothetical protein